MTDKLEVQRDLTERLRTASELYYVAGKESEFNDTEFDLKMHELEQLEKETGIILPNSPTQFVGSDIQKGFGKGQHPTPMLTIDNTYSEDELQEWADKMHEKYGVETFDAEIKYDGVSLELQYKDGVFIRALTRGDKIIGDDVTANVKGVKDIPFTLTPADSTSLRGDFYVRGEVLMPKSRLAELNQSQIAIGDKAFSNTRNACAGSLKQLDPKVTASRGLIFRAWDCFGGGMNFIGMGMKHYVLLRLGFKYEVEPTPIKYHPNNFSKEVTDFKATVDSNNLDYDYDGIVVKFELIDDQEKVGTQDTKAIGWGIARKWNENYEARTTLKNVEWQVGKTGVLTPVGILEPVECAGVIVTNVTLNNWEYIQKFNLHIPEYVTITRSGGVIPQLIGTQPTLDIRHQPVKLPERCPECGGELEFDGKLLKCTNDKCPAKAKGRILYFCSKEGCNIMSVGESVVEDLYNKNIVRDVLDIIEFAEEPKSFIDYATNLLGVGYGEKKIKKIADEIVKAKETPFEKLLASLSIPGVAKVTARNIASHFGTMQNFMAATQDELAEIEGVGEIMSKDIYEWTHGYMGATILQVLISNRWHCDAEKPKETGDNVLHGLTVCFTGKSSRFSGDDVETFLEENGAKCTHSVSKKMDYLITGDKPGGSKVAKAQELGVEIIEENDFYNKYEL